MVRILVSRCLGSGAANLTREQIVQYKAYFNADALPNAYADGAFPSLCYYEFSGCSEDEKPIGSHIAEGSTFIETDTGMFYLYCENEETWIPQLSIMMAGGQLPSSGGDIGGTK